MCRNFRVVCMFCMAPFLLPLVTVGWMKIVTRTIWDWECEALWPISLP